MTVPDDVQFCVDYLLIVKQLPDPIRGLLRQVLPPLWLRLFAASSVVTD